MFTITEDAYDYILQKGTHVTIRMETHHASGG